METKFIGLEGFNEIESLSTTKRKPNSVKRKNNAKQSTFKKTVRFVKRASTEIGRSVAEKSKKTVSASKKKVNKKSSASVLDKCYRDNRNGSESMLGNTVRDAVAGISSRNVPKHKHSAVETHKIHNFLKKKAIVASVACTMAAVFSCMTVAGALAVNPASPANYNMYVDQPGINLAAVSSPDEAFSGLYNGSNAEIPMALAADNTNCGNAALYIDGELIGVSSDRKALEAALDKVLADYRADYDAETTTEFANNVEVKGGTFDDAEFMSVEDIMSAAEGKFSIALATDMYYTQEIAYDTTVEFDESQPLSYEEVKTEGENGEEKVIVRVTFVDGVQVDAVQTEVKEIKKAVDEVIVKGGSEEDNANYSPASSNSYGAASSSGSGMFIWPMPYTHYLTSEFGWRWGRLHGGLDIADGGIYGQPIVAADSGVVTHSSDDGLGYGNYVVIDHGNGYETYYAHCSALAVSVGETVAQGQTIAYVGSTGNSTGPHLHFEIRVNGVQTDPLGYVS